MEKLEKIDQNNTVLLIEKPDVNHSTSDIKIKLTSLCSLNEEVKTNEFSESDTNNGKLNENGESNVLFEKEWRAKFCCLF